MGKGIGMGLYFVRGLGNRLIIEVIGKILIYFFYVLGD